MNDLGRKLCVLFGLFAIGSLSACGSREHIVDMPFDKVAYVTKQLFVKARKESTADKTPEEESTDTANLKRSPGFHMYYSDNVEESTSVLSFSLSPVTKFKEIYEFEITKIDNLRTQISLTSEDSRIPLLHCCCFWLFGLRGRNRLQEKKFMDVLVLSLNSGTSR